MEGRRKHLSSLQNLPTIPRPFPQVYSKEGDWTVFFVLFFFTTLLPSASLFTSMKFEPGVRWVVE